MGSDHKTGANPSWSPNGEKIAFAAAARDRGGNLQVGVYTINADGSGLNRLVEEGDSRDWSPDGQKIAYDTFGLSRVKVLRVDANAQPVGAPADLARGSYPAWSPDGNKIVYEGSTTIYKKNADGSSSRTPLVGCACAKLFHGSDWQPRR